MYLPNMSIWIRGVIIPAQCFISSTDGTAALNRIVIVEQFKQLEAHDFHACPARLISIFTERFGAPNLSVCYTAGF